MPTVNVAIDLAPVDCCVCGQIFGIRREIDQRLRESHATFFCPSGHSQHYTAKTQLEIAREELQREKIWTQRQRERADAAEKRELTEKRVKMRYKNDRDKIKARVGNGVCPCCNRTFTDLARHIQHKHPTFSTAEAE